jgi:NAD-dependent SIR2 family protein deacetylase
MDAARQTATDGVERAAWLLAGARRMVVFSGAGVSTDSRIIV